MSHELRTPLNSLLILSKLLSENADGNLLPKHVYFATTIYAAGANLLALINDILDLAKIESGTMGVEAGQVEFSDVRDEVERSFRQLAADKNLGFSVDLAAELPHNLHTDPRRLQQILKNLLSNALNRSRRCNTGDSTTTTGWSAVHEILNRALTVIAFAVTDTGIGVAPEHLERIFVRFEQAVSANHYVGLGLYIMHQIVEALGGTIQVSSEPGEGSTFTVELPSAIPVAKAKHAESVALASASQTSGTKAACIAMKLGQP